MTMIDNLTSEMGSKFGIGSAAQPLMREFLQLMTGGPGGLGGFLDRFRNAGMGDQVTSFLGKRTEEMIPPNAIDSVLGGSTVEGISQRVGLEPAVVSNAAGFEIPKLIGFLTPGGKVPAALPNEVQSLVGRAPAAPALAAEGAESAAAQGQRASSPWLWLILGLALIGALIGAFLLRTPKVATPGIPTPAVNLKAPDIALKTPEIALKAPTLPNVAAPVIDAVKGLNALLNSTVLNFETGSAQLPAASAPQLQQAADRIKALPAGTRIEIAGHTDNAGDANANLALSQHRADAVRDVLIQDGVNPSMLIAKGYGQTRPVASNETADGRAQNRRIEFSVQGG
jgi:outer membrane protein OmpA-like peptidoglycan-associated protein